MRHETPNAYKTTAKGIALAGKPRALQWVHVASRSFFGGVRERIVVTVIPGMSEPDGKAIGAQYDVNARTLQALQDGMTPEELELEPYEGPDEAEDEYADPADDRADWLHQQRMEGVRS